MRELTKKEKEYANEYLIDDSRIIGVESRTLMKIDDILRKYPCEINGGGYSGSIEFTSWPYSEKDDTEYPCIVSSMKKYFGDNKFREYFVYDIRTPEGYTHIDKKGNYYYCEEWFEPKNLLEDNLFEL
jgi:hypothetical protein